MSELEVKIEGESGQVEVAVEVIAGQRWRRKDERVPWTVAKIDAVGHTVGLTGPGPCRSYRTVSWKIFRAEWEFVA